MIKLKAEEKWIVLGIPMLFILGSFMHFIYDLTGKNFIVGLFAAVNESTWEHTKMVLIPLILWWSIYYIINNKKYNIDKNKWFTASLVSLIVSILLIPMLYYFYTEAFLIESLIIDISILFIALFGGQLLGLHLYKYSKGINSTIVIIIFIALIALYMFFTVNPPKLHLFQDTPTGQYGILKH